MKIAEMGLLMLAARYRLTLRIIYVMKTLKGNGEKLVEALCYKLECRGFDSR
jgi:hypothetical protein